MFSEIYNSTLSLRLHKLGSWDNPRKYRIIQESKSYYKPNQNHKHIISYWYIVFLRDKFGIIQIFFIISICKCQIDYKDEEDGDFWSEVACSWEQPPGALPLDPTRVHAPWNLTNDASPRFLSPNQLFECELLTSNLIIYTNGTQMVSNRIPSTLNVLMTLNTPTFIPYCNVILD